MCSIADSWRAAASPRCAMRASKSTFDPCSCRACSSPLPAEARPARFARWSQQLGAWDSWVAGQQLSALEACVAFAFSQPDVDGVVIGVDSLEHFEQLLGAARGGTVAPAYLASTDPDLINPARWAAA